MSSRKNGSLMDDELGVIIGVALRAAIQGKAPSPWARARLLRAAVKQRVRAVDDSDRYALARQTHGPHFGKWAAWDSKCLATDNSIAVGMLLAHVLKVPVVV